jgi:hypothetical protein
MWKREAPDNTYRGYEEKTDVPSPALRKTAHWAVLVAAAIFAAGVFLVGSGSILYNPAAFQMSMSHFAATIGLPCAALASLLVVIVLEGTVGPIQLKGLGFEFKGAAGPIVFWLLCFLAITFAIHLLW